MRQLFTIAKMPRGIAIDLLDEAARDENSDPIVIRIYRRTIDCGFPPVVFFRQWSDFWSSGRLMDEIQSAYHGNWVSLPPPGCYALWFPAIDSDEQVHVQNESEAELLENLSKCIKAWHDQSQGFVVLLVRQIIGVSLTAEELQAEIGKTSQGSGFRSAADEM